MARRSKLKVLALLPALVLAVAACGSSDGGSTGSSGGNTAANGVKLVEAGKIKTCTNLPYPPFQFKQGDKTVGFDVDMVDLAAKKLGVTQEIVDIQFDVIKSGAALNSGKCDVAAAGMTITDERKQNLDFTNPYFDEVIALMVPKGSGITSLDQLKDKKLGVQRGTTSLDYATEKGFTPVEFEDSGKQLQAYQAGQVDAVLQDLPVVNEWLKKQGLGDKYEVGAEIETGAQYGIAVKKGGNPELLKTLNDALDAAIKDGTWAKSYEQWMGSKPKSTPSGK
ncbi:ABC transporter substrate-binding protein [Actinokineospora diospyrosa]|uniref:Polar amino acid transport system substrate-binding protein n=1 Tax=Actinokineospora diospyrosa TaxID=103728 RepID=A0ABT1IKQ5_9PSEU|nr:ABC transporter substrate-binding protein [Actinokineospora diospyrosa]MCP2273238.1 polar amino acid transport system substrate-binding protein [Actinokineospora diospyrosa]